ncbi:helix-turn-helix domain-containing protein [Streptosporangium saharense]|uniref:helix-turn-helix domain-containing protein n=1 Tax=Streptosporangium saharense TaxID=1706840 RepID=UPI003676AA31
MTARETFSTELVRCRSEARLTQEVLAGRLHLDRSFVSHVERGKKPPTRVLAEGLDRVFKLSEEGRFVGLYEHMLREDGSLSWFMKWLDVERRAAMLQSWDPMLVPGLLQTPAYAQSVIGSNPLVDSEQVKERVLSRTQRRAILQRAPLARVPRVGLLFDEGVLHRPIGGPAVLVEQLRFLLEMATHPRLTIQITPMLLESAAGMMGAFALARLPDGLDVVTVDALFGGRTSVEADEVAEAKMWYEAIRVDAYPQGKSIRLIEDAIGTWTKE